MSDKKSIHVQSLQDELEDCKALSKALKILAGEVSCVLNEIVEKDGTKGICVSMGEEGGRSSGYLHIPYRLLVWIRSRDRPRRGQYDLY